MSGAWPSFGPEGGLALALLRGLWVAALLSSFGAGLAGGTRVLRISLWAGLIAGMAWLAAQSADMADASGVHDTVAAMGTVLGRTAFGHGLAAQLVLLAVALCVRRAAPIAAGAALVLQVSHSHAWAMDGPGTLAASDALHLLAAGAWLGGLLPLAMLVARSDVADAAVAARRFSRLGTVCVVVLVATAGYQAFVLVGSIPGAVGTAYGLTLLVKATLFGLLLVLAARHRWRLVPALSGVTRAGLARGIGVEACVGLAAAMAAGVLASLPPAMHTQPVWPFAERFTLDTVREDADFAREAGGAALAMAGAFVLFVLAALTRRWIRAGCGAAAIAVAWVAAPHLDLLFVPATPTSFATSPTGFATGSIMAGAALYPADCASCHGVEGHGDGPAGRALRIPPADLTAAHLWMHSDGEMIWWLSHGIEAPDGGLAMPGFGDVLSEADRWALIDFVRARNAGLAFAADGRWPVPLRAPGFAADCGGVAVPLDEMGTVVRIALSASGAVVDRGDQRCVVDDAAVPAAYALVLGMPNVNGAQVLVDARGLLRAALMPDAHDWDDPSVLARAEADVAAKPVAAAGDAMDHMHMKM